MSFPKAPQQGRGGVGVEPRQVGPESGTKGPSGETSLSGLPLWPYVFLLCSSLLNAAVFPVCLQLQRSPSPRVLPFPEFTYTWDSPA